MASIKFKNVYLNDYTSIVGPYEKNGQIKKYDDYIDDFYFGSKTFEHAEVKMQNVVIDKLLKKGSVDVIIGGDLLNQISITGYSARKYSYPFFGIYSACASFVQGMFLLSSFISAKQFKKGLVVTSSHNLNSEKQFRFPVEYGAPKPKTSTFTATGATSAIISQEVSKIAIESGTLGRIEDLGVKDANNLGAAMAPAACTVIMDHLNELRRDINYYDLVLTGDLGDVGYNILKELLKNKNIILNKYMDAGKEIYNFSDGKYSGASGPVALPLVLFNKVLLNKKYKKILIVGTGALHSPVMLNQKDTIPCVAHAISLEVTV